MANRVVDLNGQPRQDRSPPVSDFWFNQLDLRLGRIEFMVSRLEWQIWLIVCGGFGLLALEVFKSLTTIEIG